MIELVNKNQCTGCKMCGDICPKSAISFSCGEDGFWYPVVDDEFCIKCGLCVKNCPELNESKIKNREDTPVYAAWSVDDEVRFESTSGGVYFEIAKAFLENGGYLAGCVFADGYKSARHVVGNTIEDLYQIMGTKYFQSDTAGIYKAVADLLNNGEKVLFSGTPCQIAALYQFLGRKCENLYLIDFICKGINSPKAYKAYLQELEKKYHSPVKSVRQKSKKTGWESLATNIKFENGKEYHKDRYTDWWIQGYTCGNLFMREACQECQYKGMDRIADVTVGDFWGIKGCSEQDMTKGISVVFINSAKGQQLLEKTGGRLYLEKRSLKEVLKGNPYLYEQAVQRGDRKLFFELLDKCPFSVAVKKVYTETFIQKIKRYIKLILKRFFGRKKW